MWTLHCWVSVKLFILLIVIYFRASWGCLFWSTYIIPTCLWHCIHRDGKHRCSWQWWWACQSCSKTVFPSSCHWLPQAIEWSEKDMKLRNTNTIQDSCFVTEWQQRLSNAVEECFGLCSRFSFHFWFLKHSTVLSDISICSKICWSSIFKMWGILDTENTGKGRSMGSNSVN